MDDAKKQLLDRLKNANNVLVTVSRDPSVDQLSACIGLALLLNKQGKHTAAVFSGHIPSTIEFLKPEETIEKNTDSLRDFIISLDKSKADKLRYKVEDNVVRIFITPYKTSISETDLEFAQGDFNVDVVVALGVKDQQDLDQAITAHGRILHDATVATITITPDGDLGTINWYDSQASSLSELITDLAQSIGEDLIDNQIATALLTGIVSETGRFSNDKTSAQTMSASAALLAAGANQQLVASQLEASKGKGDDNAAKSDNGALSDNQVPQNDDGTIEIDHSSDSVSGLEPAPSVGLPEADTLKNNDKEISATDSSAEGASSIADIPEAAATAIGSEKKPKLDERTVSDGGVSSGSKLVTEPPVLGGTLTANSREEGLEPSTDPLSMPTSEPPQLLDRKPGLFSPPSSSPAAPPSLSAASPSPSPSEPSFNPSPEPSGAPAPFQPAPAGFTPPAVTDWTPPAASPPSPQPAPSESTDDLDDKTLTDIEKSVDSPHAKNLDDARDEVSKALSDASVENPPIEPIQALNAQPLGEDLHPSDGSVNPPSDAGAPPSFTPPDVPPTPPSMPPAPSQAQQDQNDPNAPPPVPPPIPFQFGNSS